MARSAAGPDGALFVLAPLILTAGDARRTARFRRKWEPERKRLVEPHATLVFATPASELARLRAALSRQAFGGVEVALSPARAQWNRFAGRFDVFWPIAGAGGRYLEKAHRRLYVGALRKHLAGDEPYRPHVTIGGADDEREARRAAAEAPRSVGARLGPARLTQIRGGRLHPL